MVNGWKRTLLTKSAPWMAQLKMHSTIHAVCGQQKGQNRAKSHVWLIFKQKNFFFFFLVKRAGRHFGFFKRAGRHEKRAGRRALQKKPRQNTEWCHVLRSNVSQHSIGSTLECLINVPVRVFISRKMPPYTGLIWHYTFLFFTFKYISLHILATQFLRNTMNSPI